MLLADIEDLKKRTKWDMNEWSSKMSDRFQELGYGDEWTHAKDPSITSFEDKKSFKPLKNYPYEGYAYLYRTVKDRNPLVHAGIHNIFNRPDFIDSTDNEDKLNYVQTVESGRTARKSEYLYILGE